MKWPQIERKNLRFGLAALLPSAVAAAPALYFDAACVLPFLGLVWAFLFMTRRCLHEHQRSIGLAALAYGGLLTLLGMAAMGVAFRWMNDEDPLRLADVPGLAFGFLVIASAILAAAVLGFGLPTALWMRQVMQNDESPNADHRKELISATMANTVSALSDSSQGDSKFTNHMSPLARG